MVSVSHHITKLILLNNIFEIKSIMVLGRIQRIRCFPVFMLENSIFWNFSIDEMIVISVFFKISIRKNFTHDSFRFILFNFFSLFFPSTLEARASRRETDSVYQRYFKGLWLLEFGLSSLCFDLLPISALASLPSSAGYSSSALLHRNELPALGISPPFS